MKYWARPVSYTHLGMAVSLLTKLKSNAGGRSTSGTLLFLAYLKSPGSPRPVSYTHLVQIGVDICKKYRENPQIIHAIEAHHGDVEPKTVLAFIIMAAEMCIRDRPWRTQLSYQKLLPLPSVTQKLVKAPLFIVP